MPTDRPCPSTQPGLMAPVNPFSFPKAPPALGHATRWASNSSTRVQEAMPIPGTRFSDRLCCEKQFKQQRSPRYVKREGQSSTQKSLPKTGPEPQQVIILRGENERQTNGSCHRSCSPPGGSVVLDRVESARSKTRNRNR